MNPIEVGAVDVYLIDPTPGRWQLLVLRRASGTRCTGAWEGVHGRIEQGESPQDAAAREVFEETGLDLERLYNVTCQPFYLHRQQLVMMAVVFAAFVRPASVPQLSAEHDAFEWLPYEDGIGRIVWPRSRDALREIELLLAAGDAGPVEDVMRVR